MQNRKKSIKRAFLLTTTIAIAAQAVAKAIVELLKLLSELGVIG